MGLPTSRILTVAQCNMSPLPHTPAHAIQGYRNLEKICNFWKKMAQRLSPEECTSWYCACCPASKDSFLTQFADITQYNTHGPSSGGNWPRSPTATAAWQSQCLQKPLRHYHTKKQNHLPAPGLGIKTAPSSKAMNQQCCSWVVQPILQSRWRYSRQHDKFSHQTFWLTPDPAWHRRRRSRPHPQCEHRRGLALCATGHRPCESSKFADRIRWIPPSKTHSRNIAKHGWFSSSVDKVKCWGRFVHNGVCKPQHHKYATC